MHRGGLTDGEDMNNTTWHVTTTPEFLYAAAKLDQLGSKMNALREHVKHNVERGVSCGHQDGLTLMKLPWKRFDVFYVVSGSREIILVGIEPTPPDPVVRNTKRLARLGVVVYSTVRMLKACIGEFWDQQWTTPLETGEMTGPICLIDPRAGSMHLLQRLWSFTENRSDTANGKADGYRQVLVSESVGLGKTEVGLLIVAQLARAWEQEQLVRMEDRMLNDDGDAVYGESHPFMNLAHTTGAVLLLEATSRCLRKSTLASNASLHMPLFTARIDTKEDNLPFEGTALPILNINIRVAIRLIQKLLIYGVNRMRHTTCPALALYVGSNTGTSVHATERSDFARNSFAAFTREKRSVCHVERHQRERSNGIQRNCLSNNEIDESINMHCEDVWVSLIARLRVKECEHAFRSKHADLQELEV